MVRQKLGRRVSKLSFGLLLLGASEAAADSFDPAIDLSVGNVPLGVAIADLDGDGRLDLVVAAHEDHKLVAFRNTTTAGTLSFAPGLDLPTRPHPQDVAIADLDDDGLPEVVSADSGDGGGGGISIFPNASTPGTLSFDTRTGPAVDTAHRVAIADFDGDGQLDLVVTANSPQQIHVYDNQSTSGSLAFVAAFTVPTSTFPNGIAAGDLDGDGKPEILAPMTDANDLLIFLNQSSPSSFDFAAAVDFPVGNTPDEAALADFDLDGRLDVAVNNRGDDTISLYINASTPGTLSFATRQDFACGPDPTDVAAGDVDEDGRPDVVVTNSDDKLSILEGAATSSGVILELVKSLTTGDLPFLLAIGDLDGNGLLDLATGNHDGTSASIFLNAQPTATAADHLLLCEVALTPTAGEFIEIVNPTASAVSLEHYYLADDDAYAHVPEDSPGPSILASDFIVQFPPGTFIEPGGVVVVALDGAGFASTYGEPADFEIRGTHPATPDMIPTHRGASAGMTDSGEHAVLFYWDGETDLVADVDLVNIGTPTSLNAVGTKTGLSIDGPDGDFDASTYVPDGGTMPTASSDPGSGESAKRALHEGTSESPAGGNGLTGHDETSEDILFTWDSEYDDYVPPDPGFCCLTVDCLYADVDETDATTLRATLHPVIDDHHRLTYDELWDPLEIAQEDLADSGQIVDLYKNSPYPKDRMDYQREHSWPSSYGFPDDHSTNYPFTDAHHLFLADGTYNNIRSNKPYRFCDGLCTELPTDDYDGRGGGFGTYPGNSNWTEGALTAGTWETWTGRRGDVARALFYMDLRYEGGTHAHSGAPEPNLSLTDDEGLIAQWNTGDNESQGYMGILSDLLEWHDEDPVDDRERLKNELLDLFQRNRNPFVDHPEWAGCIYENVCPGADLTITKDDGVLEVFQGGTVAYTLLVGNNGPSDVVGALVTDAFDPEMFDVGIITWTCEPAPGSGGATTCSAAGDADDLSAGVPVSIEAGDSVVFTVEAPVATEVSGTLVNTASVTAPAGVLDRELSSNSSTDTDEVLVLGTCGHPETRTLTNRTVDTMKEIVACLTISAGDGVWVVSPGELTLRAGQRVVLGDGFSVGEGGRLQVVIDGELSPE